MVEADIVLVDDVDRLAREVNDMKALPPAKKRRIGFVIDED
jgi:DNA invertase Pin-like site-specific DNA recombinase